jgi:hypothetical protein
MKICFLKIIFQTFLYLFAIRKVNQQKILYSKKSKKKLTWFPEKYFFFNFERKTLSRKCEKLIKILFFYYIKFGPQSFDCHIFCFEFFFQSHPLKFDLI